MSYAKSLLLQEELVLKLVMHILGMEISIACIMLVL